MSLSAQDCTPSHAIQSQESLQDIDLASAQDYTPEDAPVSEPLTGKERAGVNLTWGIIGVLIGFLVIILCIFMWGEYQFFAAMRETQNLILTNQVANSDALMQLTQQRSDFRAFWFDTLQLILLNVLFPTLTALLGYVFGTSRNGSS
ncbi:hypothetical protein [Pseudoalteromonas luteoviolacea]|uniref:Uncharacterized protein n=1 Tax=Pseudoalteromonas luteoviolacea H33 TaxID=1365251 RepID=A0A167A5M7_9GAMM|nr:hypothetical protein [Pseudoalteromonas luteoviolacea]KZN45009.1 hypothetical protein N476_25495 [Pseudoalteromonas luteoviolacea H33]KZN79317.1 hypothetical protein N477_00520 [Pseudoalteromonas luteoviolacea H33-S]MBQ4877956.1 hypothetical protein [Pseudoalteromonas luteoviolacea]MBQ4906991.1 hypothetical protein [Pseudoalteromonas luteoviolacea]